MVLFHLLFTFTKQNFKKIFDYMKVFEITTFTKEMDL